MRVHKHTVGKIYPKYQPYPLTFGSEDCHYASEPQEDSRSTPDNHRISESSDDLPDLTDDRPTPDWLYPESLPSNDAARLHPLRHLQSLFSDRLDFLQRTLDDLESAKKERQQIVESALEELDSEISRCDKSMATLKAAFNNTEQQRLLERRLLELKRDRRREALLSWRDLIWLRGEIRNLQREIETLEKTAGPAKNREAPT
jgi:DNA repair exonuclease SbcCD ATPase subunit